MNKRKREAWRKHRKRMKKRKEKAKAEDNNSGRSVRQSGER